MDAHRSRLLRPTAIAIAVLLAACDGAGGVVPPCIGAQRPVSMTPPRLTGALAEGMSGTVRIDYVIERDGRVADVQVRRRRGATDEAEALPPEVERALLGAIGEWRFGEPLMRCRGRMDLALAVDTGSPAGTRAD